MLVAGGGIAGPDRYPGEQRGGRCVLTVAEAEQTGLGEGGEGVSV